MCSFPATVLLVFSGQTAQSFEPGSRWAGQRAVLTMYDISNLSDPQLIATLTIDGDVLDARLVGTQVRVVTASSPDVDAPSPVYAPDGDISEKSKDELRAAVAKHDRRRLDSGVHTAETVRART